MAITYKFDTEAEQVEEVNKKPIQVKETQSVTSTTTITLDDLVSRRDAYQTAIEQLDAQIAEIKASLKIEG